MITESHAARPAAPDKEADAAGMLHDFNNAMQTAGAILRQLARRIEREEKAELPPLVAAMQRQLTQIATFGPAMSRATARPDVPAVRPGPVAIGPFLQAIAVEIEALLPPSVRLDLVAGPGSGTVHCDPARLESGVRNLVLNARDAMDGEGRLLIRARRVQLGTDGTRRSFAEITVRDTGCGMAPDTLRRCLEPFMTTKAGKGGSGLGLHQVRTFADGLGGSVRLQSCEGKGTTVLLLLPEADPPAA